MYKSIPHSTSDQYDQLIEEAHIDLLSCEA